MTETTRTPSTPQALSAIPWFPTATPEQQALVQQDAAKCLAEGIDLAEYVQLASEFGTAAEYLAEAGLEVSAPTPEATVPAQAAQAAEEAARQEEHARQEADSTLKATVKAFRKGERAYAAGLLESGRLADQYLHQRMALGDPRANGVKAIEGELAKWSSSTVQADRLIRCYHAYRLLAVEQPDVKADNVPYGTYRDAYCQLVQRLDKDTPEEHWTLLPGLEAECKAVFAKSVADSLSQEGVKAAVQAVVRVYADRQADEAGARAQAKAQAEAAAQAQLQAIKVDADKLAEAKAQAEAAAETATAETKAALTAAAEEAKAALLAKQRELVEAHAKAQAESKASSLALSLAREAEKAKAKAEAKELARAQKAATATAEKAKAPGSTESRPPSALAMAKAGTVKDVAGMACELVTGCEEPDDVFAELLRLLKASGELSKQSGRAIDAALLVLARSDKASPSPVAVAKALTPTNNTPAAAVA